MRSEDREPVGARSAPGPGGRRLVERIGLGPLSGWLRDRRAAPRRVAALAIASALIALASSMALVPESPRGEWLDRGRSFAPDEAQALLNELAIKGIAAEADDRGRVSVDPDRAAEALRVLDQLGLGRKSLSQELDDPARPSLMADATERAEVLLRAEARKVERALEGIPGIQSAVVVLKPKPGRPFTRPEAAGAGVLLRSDRGRAISPTTVDRAINVVTTFTALDAEEVTVLDANGDALLKAGDPSFARSMRAEARARSWEAAIAEELARVIDGAIVEVRVEEPMAGRGDAPATAATVGAGPPEFEPAPAEVVAVPNGPMSLDPGPPPAAEAVPLRRPGAPAASRANVLVKVPASYYLARHDAFHDGKESRRDALVRFVAFTEEYVRTIVAHVVPEGSLGRVQILMQPLPNEAAEPPAASRQARGDAALWWAPAAVLGGAAASALIAAAGGWRPGRRPALRSSREAAGTPRPHLSPLRDDDAPGPADRVRELVRSDPAAAAAVLRRWVEQGADA